MDRVVSTWPDARTFPFKSGYDLAVTHFFLDCLEERDIEVLARGIAASRDGEMKWLTSVVDL